MTSQKENQQIIWQKTVFEMGFFSCNFWKFFDILENLHSVYGQLHIDISKGIFTVSADIKFLEELGINNMTTNNLKENMTNLLDVRNLIVRKAKKAHTCSFSGRPIYEGQDYWELPYTQIDGSKHYTYRVALDELEQFVKEKLFMVAGQDVVSMEKDISELGLKIDAIHEKYKNMPEFEDRYLRAVSLASRS